MVVQVEAAAAVEAVDEAEAAEAAVVVAVAVTQLCDLPLPQNNRKVSG